VADLPTDLLTLVPMSLAKANDFVSLLHRHNGRTARNGGKFAIGVLHGTKLVGVSIVGNPISATLMDGFTAEVLRVCTRVEAPKGCCSMLYAACWRAWRAMGGRKLVTYTLESESGASLRGAGWKLTGKTKPVGIGWRKKDHVDRRSSFTFTSALVKNRWEVTI
jgi:hypothetical protein